MKLTSYLEQLSPSTLKKILNEHQIPISTLMPNELVETISHWLTFPEKMELIYRQMTKIEKDVLSYFIFQIPNQAFSYRKLDRIVGSLSRDEFEYGLIKLRRKGILFTLRRNWGDLAFIMPEDLFRLLTYIHIEEVPITQRGTIHKRHMTKLLNQLDIRELTLEHFPFREKVSITDDPKNIQFLLELAFAIGLVERFNTLTTTRKAYYWHSLDRKVRVDILKGYVRALYKPTDLFYHHLFYLLFHLPSNQWFSLSRIIKGLARKLKRPVGQEILERASMEILQPLEAFGWIEFVFQEGDQFIRWKEEEVEISQIYVQPNYEILVPKTFPHSLRLTVEQCALMKQKDQMNSYVLTKESILHALEKGYMIDEIIGFLETYSAIPVSENLKTSLWDWAKHYGNISFMNVMIMKCQTKALANQLKKDPLLKDWIIGKIDSTHLIVKRDQFQKGLDRLYQLGYYPKKEIWTEESLDLQDEETEEDVFEWFRNSEYRIENIFPNLTRSFN